MKKILLFLVCFSVISGGLFAQERTVSGIVTGKDDGLAVPGASVKVVGSNNGTQTGPDGKFILKVTGTPQLQISFIGYVTQEVSSARSPINISLAPDSKQLQEVVVTTALNINRTQRSLGYAVGKVDASELTVAKSNDLSSSLAGKVAGVQLQGSPSSTFDNANVIVRGINGLAPGNPLYVVDGTPTLQENVIMDNVENISILKGGAATALYGNRAANGVILITTKKGTRTGAPKIDANLSTSFENISVMPEYQNQYAGGYTSSATAPGTTYDAQGFMIFRYNPTVHPASWASFNNQRILDYGADESWGPKMNGDLYRAYWSWYPGAEFGQLTPLVAQPDNVKNFFQTGKTFNNSVAFSGGAENLRYRLTYGNINRSLVIPNAKRDQHQFGVNGDYDINKRLTISTDIAYTTFDTKGQPEEGYLLNGLNVAQNFNQWFQRQVDLERLKNYRNADNSLNSWNIGDPRGSSNPKLYLAPQYWDSPWFVVNENYGTDVRNRIVGNFGFKYKILDWLSANAFGRMSLNNGKNDFRVAAGGLQPNSYSQSQLQNNETNYEANLIASKKFNNITLDGLVGSNIRHNKSDYLYVATAGGLTFPDYFAIAGSVARPTTTRTYAESEVRSVYARASAGYKNFLFLEGSLRNDWSSTLPVANNSYFYPSINSSLVFTDLIKSSGLKKVLSYGKIRAGFAQTGSDLSAYQVQVAINNGSIFGSNPSAEIGNQFRSGNVKPALTKSYEAGLELNFFNKFGLDVTYFQDNNIDQILGLDVASASGFTSAQVNAGNIQRKGIEISLNATPIKTAKFSWNTLLNFANSESVIKELSPGIQTYLYNSQRNDFRIENRVGQQWGTIIGRTWKTDAQGRYIFATASGNIDYNTNQELGMSITPDFTGGMFNSFTYGNLDMSFSLDFQKGGNFFSITKLYGEGSGLFSSTTGVNDKGVDIREFPSLGGGVRIDGVYNGNPTTLYVPARQYYYTNYARDSRNAILSSSYLKLREVRLGYKIPATVIGSKVLKSVNVGAIVGNAWLIAAPAKEFGIDPSELESYGREGGQLSSTRTIGLNIRVGL